MHDFLTWVESKSQIRVIGYDKTGEITFQVGSDSYTYLMDAGYFYNGFFPRWMKYQPGKALNFAKERGELIRKNRRPIQPEPPPPTPDDGKPIQRELF